MLQLLLVAVSVLLFAGCKKSADPQATPITSPQPIETPASSSPATAAPPKTSEQAEATLAASLAQLTQVLRKYSAEKQQVPKSLQELVTSGYITELPVAPPGKKFAINEKRVEVIIVNR